MKNVLFLNLTAFSQTGGIEKFNRCFLKALAETELDKQMVSCSYSLYDVTSDEKYYTATKYTGFAKNRISFVLKSVAAGLKSDVVILGHINLALVGFVIKILSPSKKMVLICHGIEVWEPLSFIKKTVLNGTAKILAVSTYTRERIVAMHSIAQEKIEVFHNTIDPYFPLPKAFGKSKILQKRYGLKEDDFVLFTLCRLSSAEQYKGYDYVIQAMSKLHKRYPNIKYVIAGKYDEVEINRMKNLISDLNLSDNVIFTGYVDDKEIIDHYQLGNVYIMPSQKEGFGIVFIEAMACGQRVIAGNIDGSVDALANGEMGKLVNPTDADAIASAIEAYYLESGVWNDSDAAKLQEKVVSYFGFEKYKNRLRRIIPTLL